MTSTDLISRKFEQQIFKPVFIMGDHRSGTTLLYQTLVKTNLFAYINAYQIIRFTEIIDDFEQGTTDSEIEKLTQKFQQLGIGDRVFDKVEVTPTLPEEYGFILSNAGYERFINQENISFMEEICQKSQYIQLQANYLLLKNPWCNPHFLFIKQQFPDAKFIFIHRNPSHVINSKLKAIRQTLSVWSPYTALISKRYSEIFKNPLRRAFYRMMYSNFFDLGVKRALSQSIESSTAYLEDIGKLDKHDYFELTYEEFCSNPNQRVQDILDFLNLNIDQKIDFSKNISPRKVDLLPEVEKNLSVIQETFKKYLEEKSYKLG
ncbi:hypothetical protein Lepto7376_3638 [[Leptolyngbya] sp. PCC 7376]|uniref:sulfotransferase family protein n=1 Tax=[Leptolyngbya] sp. PCC 7376 TaxID=111781 RepID=UPI00029ECB74|nr:sulfotransferase [[Leptolyngbya] sp. PCC 7376]AFY39818.1 hypothetical protein Lepto7376_3638 [[Leptolyngbya] sp. PCC 7376]